MMPHRAKHEKHMRTWMKISNACCLRSSLNMKNVCHRMFKSMRTVAWKSIVTPKIHDRPSTPCRSRESRLFEKQRENDACGAKTSNKTRFSHAPDRGRELTVFFNVDRADQLGHLSLARQH